MVQKRFSASAFYPDEIPGYECLKFALPEEDDGPLWATLVRKHLVDEAPSLAHQRPAVLYLHGYCDYFFQTHLADAIERAGFRFYALELRRYGRSIGEGNRPNQARDIGDYGSELDWALEYIVGHHAYIAGAIAHSTGGLILCHYLKQSAREVPCVVLNSPFLKFNLPRKETFLMQMVVQSGGAFPYFKIPKKMPGGYGKTLHVSQFGEWSYNLNYKPLYGFPLYPAWFRMIHRAHAQVRAGLGLQIPILAMRSSRSKFPSDPPTGDDFKADTVLNVDDMKRLAPLLSSHVEQWVVEDGLHDLFLSNQVSRAAAVDRTIRFLNTHGRR